MNGLRSDERGIALVITAIAMVALIGLVALVVDSGFLEHRKLTLQKAADAAALRASQLYYDGNTTDAQIDQAARETARANLLLANFDPAQAEQAAAEMQIQADPAAGTVRTTVSAAQRLYFASGITAAGESSLVVSPAAASFVRKDAGRQHYRHLYLIVSVFASMSAEFQQGHAQVTYTTRQGTSAIGKSKAAAAVAGVQQVLNTLDGEFVTLIGYGNSNDRLLREVPVDDNASVEDPNLTNRQLAVRRTADLLNNQLGAKLKEALETAKSEITNLEPEDRETALVLLVTDGVGFGSRTDIFNTQGENECWIEGGAALQAANAIRELGATVSAIGIFTFGAGMSSEIHGQETADEIWQQIGMLGRNFLKSLAAAHRYPIICGINTTVFPNNVKPGQYFEPSSEREIAVFFDETTSRAEFTGKLPRRIHS